MIRCALLLLLLIIGPAQAQTPSLIPIPQTVPIPLVPNGLDASGNFTSRQISSNEILTPLPYSTSSNTAVLGFGQMTISLDNPNGFIVGQVVQVTAPDGQYLIGALVALDLSTFNATINAIVPNQGAGVYTAFQVQVVGGSNINGVPVWAGLSIDGVDSITYPTAAGATMTLNVETGKAFSHFSSVYVWAPQDITTWVIGTVITYNTTTGAMTVFVKQASTTGLTYSTNYVSMIDSAAIDAALTNYSSTPYNGASTGGGGATTPSTLKMTVSLPGSLVGGGGGAPTPSATLVAGTVFPFTVVAGQYFPIQGNVLLDDLTPGVNNHYIASVYSYVGTTLQLLIQSVFGTGAPSTAWGMYLIAGPASRIPPYGISGLQVSQVTTSASLSIAAGCVRDSQDQVDLCLNGTTTLDLSNSANIVSAQGAGTTSSFGGGTTTLTGSGTSFTTFFSGSGTLSDLTNQTTSLGLSAVTARSLIWDGHSVMTNISAVTNNTSATLGQAVSGTNGTYFRGGPITTTGCLNLECDFGIILARNDSTGVVSPFGVSFTPSGAPDLPVGYTYYRVIAAAGLYWTGTQYVVSLLRQPLMPVQVGQLVSGITLPFLGSIVPAGYILGASALPSPTLNSIAFNATGTAAQSFLVNNNGSVAFVPGSYGLPISSISGRPAVSLSTATNTLSGDVNLNNVSNYFDGPSMAQGTTGTWFASGTVTVGGTGGDVIKCKLWDGTTVIASTEDSSVNVAASSLSLSGYLASPAGNIRISCNDATNTTGKIKFNVSGNSADSSIWGFRIQ